MVFINKLDRERASFDRTLEQLAPCWRRPAVERSIGEEAALVGVADLLTHSDYL